MCDLVHLLSVGILQFYINQSMCSHFRKSFLLRVCLRWQENALLQKGIWLVAWSQSVRMLHPMALLQGDGSSVQLQEARVPEFSFLKQ